MFNTAASVQDDDRWHADGDLEYIEERTTDDAADCGNQTRVTPYSLREHRVEVPIVMDDVQIINLRSDKCEKTFKQDSKIEGRAESKRTEKQQMKQQSGEGIAQRRMQPRSHALREPPAKITTLHKKTSTKNSDKHDMSEKEWLRWIREDEVMIGDRPTRSSVEEQPEEGDGSFAKKNIRGKAQAIFKRAEDKVMQNVLSRDKTARDNILSRQRKNSKAPYVVDFQLSVEDEVSFDGNLYKIRSVNGPPGEAVTSTIENKESGKTRKVRVSELRPTATPRPTTFLEREGLSQGDFIFYEGEEEVRGGRVTNNDDDDVVIVHIYEGTAGTLTIWLPTWANNKSERKRAKKQPAGFAGLEETIDRQDIIMSGRLTATDRMTASTVKEAVNRGILTAE